MCKFTLLYLSGGEKWWAVESSGGKVEGYSLQAIQRKGHHSGGKQVRQMFMGEYNHTIDTKGRLIIPSKFRDQLGDEFIVTKGLDGCLFVFPKNEWLAFEEKLRTLPMTQKSARKFTRFFVSGAIECELDKQGRILLPQPLREFAELEKDVVLTGNLNRIEIWSKANWTENNAYDDMDDIAEQMTDLGLVI